MKVCLKFFEDDVNGEWGLAHDNAIERGFNAFWNPIGIFHDVFEHYFEEEHPYFRGDAAFNIGGEIAATGHMAWYIHLGTSLRSTLVKGWNSIEQAGINTTQSLIVDAANDEDFNFGHELYCKVPRQREIGYDIDAWYLNSMYISEHQYMLKKFKEEYRYKDIWNNDGTKFLKSCTNSKLHDLYWWGYKQARKIAPKFKENGNVLNQFLQYWDKFCTEHSAKSMGHVFDYVYFDVNTNSKGVLSWDCEFRDRETAQFVNYRVANPEWYLEQIEEDADN